MTKGLVWMSCLFVGPRGMAVTKKKKKRRIRILIVWFSGVFGDLCGKIYFAVRIKKHVTRFWRSRKIWSVCCNGAF